MVGFVVVLGKQAQYVVVLWLGLQLLFVIKYNT
jgi:hypothetical protein